MQVSRRWETTPVLWGITHRGRYNEKQKPRVQVLKVQYVKQINNAATKQNKTKKVFIMFMSELTKLTKFKLQNKINL